MLIALQASQKKLAFGRAYQESNAVTTRILAWESMRELAGSFDGGQDHQESREKADYFYFGERDCVKLNYHRLVKAPSGQAPCNVLFYSSSLVHERAAAHGHFSSPLLTLPPPGRCRSHVEPLVAQESQFSHPSVKINRHLQ